MYLLHGALGSAKELIPISSELSDATLFDFPGHGDSKETLNHLTIETLAKWTASQITEKDIKKVFGHSMGGYIGLFMAARGIRPIKKIITYGTKLNWTREFYETQSNFLDIDNIKANIPKLSGLLEKTHGAKWEKLIVDTLSLMKDLSEGNGLSDQDFIGLDSEVIFLIGSKDRMVSIDETARVCEFNPKFKMVVLENQVHELFKVDPQLIITHF